MSRSASAPRPGRFPPASGDALRRRGTRDLLRRFFEFRPLPTWVQVTVLVVLTVLAADDARLFLADADQILADRAQLMVNIGLLAGYVAGYLALLRTPWATLFSLPMLVFQTLTGDFIAGLLGGPLVVLFAPVTSSWLTTVIAWGIYGTWTVVASVLRGPLWGESLWPLLLIYTAAALAGTAARRFQDDLARNRHELEELERENASIREDERAALARELHDVVAHELSLISLQITSRSQSDDPAELHRVLDSVRRSTQSALYELRLLVGLLRSDGPGDESDLGGLNVDTSVGEAGAALASRLRELGYDVELSISPGADDLPSTLASTLIRILQESSTNVIKHAPPGSRFRGEVRVTPHNVLVSLRNPLGDGRTDPALHHGPTGWGLRGLAERVDLLGGQFAAGPRDGQWVVSSRIPLSADEVG